MILRIMVSIVSPEPQGPWLLLCDILTVQFLFKSKDLYWKTLVLNSQSLSLKSFANHIVVLIISILK